MRVVINTALDKAKTLCDGIAVGFDAISMTPKSAIARFDDIEEFIIYGFLRGGSHLIKRCIAENKKFYYVDHGWFGRTKGYTDLKNSYFRFSKNEMQNTVYKDCDNNRLKRHNLEIKDYVNSGHTYIIAPPTENVKNNFEESIEWEKDVINEMNSLSFPVIVRTKKQKGTPIDWNSTKRLVTYNSTLLIESLLNGVRVVCPKTCSASLLGFDYYDTSEPDREKFLSFLSYTQFNLTEITNGYAKKMINKIYGD